MNKKVLFIFLVCMLFVLTSCDLFNPPVDTKLTRKTDIGESIAEELIVNEFITDEIIPLENLNRNLLFIHHSVGCHWLNDGELIQTLNKRGYNVSSITYGYYKTDEYGINGDMTDINDWLKWFTDDVMNRVYQEHDKVSSSIDLHSSNGENTIIMFKTFYPNSDVGDSISDEIKIYNQLLDYFKLHTNKMFIIVTPPPMVTMPTGDKTRELYTWLIDRENGWLQNYDFNNVYAFDLFNVLTHPDNHHTLVASVESHNVNHPSNELFYNDYGDDHANKEGLEKATKEFSPLLDYWYELFISSD